MEIDEGNCLNSCRPSTNTSTKSGDSGNGGKSVISSKLKNKTINIKQKVSGSNNGNGKIKISFVRE